MAVPSASQTPVQHRRRRGDDGRDDEGTERETGEHVVDVVDSGGHSRGGDRQRERQREPGEAGDDEDAGGGEGSGQDGVIRRPRQSPLPGQLSTVAVSTTLQGRGSSTSSLTAS